MNDEILDEFYAMRERIAEECGYDFKRLGDRYKRLQERCPPELLVTTKVPRSDPDASPPMGASALDEDDFEDEIVREVHAARAKIMEECGYDMKKLFERLRRSQEEHPERLVTHVPATTEPQPEAKAER